MPGLAAIQLAHATGAEVFATASAPKQGYLRSLGVEHVFDSRNTKFGHEILEATSGEGVDVVLNSLTGEGFIEARMMDPQQRMLLETTWQALQDAGIDQEVLRDSHTGRRMYCLLLAWRVLLCLWTWTVPRPLLQYTKPRWPSCGVRWTWPWPAE